MNELFFDVCVAEIFYAALGDHHQVDGALEQIWVVAEDLTHQAFDAVAGDGSSNLP